MTLAMDDPRHCNVCERDLEPEEESAAVCVAHDCDNRMCRECYMKSWASECPPCEALADKLEER